MALIAQSSINIASISDAYSVSLQPSNIVVKADFNGANPALTNAFTIISLYCGDEQVSIEKAEIANSSLWTETSHKTDCALTKSGPSYKLAITSVGNDLEGWRDVYVYNNAGQIFSARFSYTVVRETSMIDWVVEWSKNYTDISGDHIATPNALIGRKDANGLFSGIYIGADMPNHTAGIYAVKDCPSAALAQGNIENSEIFHLNETGGMIGGWSINVAGISTTNSVGSLEILSEGTIHYLNNKYPDKPFWELKKDGTGSFASGNIRWNTAGDAFFKGTITAQSGLIGGWQIGKKSLFNTSILINSTEKFIGIRNITTATATEPAKADFYRDVKDNGGVAIFFDNAASYGLESWNGNEKTFSLGSDNQIAGWKFNHQAIWTGATIPSLTKGSYATEANSLTMAPNGIRSCKWYADADGTASFVGGSVKFNTDNAEMFGWLMRSGRFSSKYAALVSDEDYAGVYVSVADISEIGIENLKQTISSNGGIYMHSNGTDAAMEAYDENGNLGFSLDISGHNTIGKWIFNHESIYTGGNGLNTEGYTQIANSIILSINGLIGSKWKLLADGSGAIAGGNIRWEANGDITLSNQVTLSWSSIKDGPNLTKIDANGIYTGTISANNITAGTISTASIMCDGKWKLGTDGSGYLASQNLSWNKNGDLTVKGTIEAKSGSIAGFAISEGHIGIDASSTDETTSTSQQGSWANLSIYKDFFKVGGEKGYVMFGNDVIPASAGGAFTATGRIVNNAPNSHGSYGFDQANYGLFIDVTGGTKNYGVSSNAALKAPAFINTNVKILTFTSQNYSVDFSQNNIFLLYYNEPEFAGVDVTLPSEDSVARQFGLSALPDDFGTILTFRLRPGSKPVTLKGIYNANETLQDYKLVEGDTVQVLVSKIDGFRYQILNHSD